MTLGDVWFVLVGVLFAGYAIFDGFDLGVGVLYPFLGKSEQDRSVMRRAIGPVWDGNEVWLLAAAGALCAAFPAVYATVFSGFYLALMLVLFSLIFRAVALELGHSDSGWKRFWDGAFFAGSAIPALVFGVAVGNIVRGLPLTAAGEMIAGAGEPTVFGNLLAALNPYALVIGLLGFSWIVLQGTAWLGLKATHEVHARALTLRAKMLLVFAAMVVIAAVATGLVVPGAFTRVVSSFGGWLFVVVTVGATVAAQLFATRGQDLKTFIATSFAAMGLVGIWGAAIYPALVPALAGSAGEALTVANSASSDLTLTVMLIVAVIGIPLVVAYFFIVYRAYAGRVDENAEY